MSAQLSRREFLQAGGALVIGMGFSRGAAAQRIAGADAALGKTLDASELDGFLAVHADSTVTLYCGKVDLGQGLRIAIRQMAAEELGITVDRRRTDSPGGRDCARSVDPDGRDAERPAGGRARSSGRHDSTESGRTRHRDRVAGR